MSTGQKCSTWGRWISKAWARSDLRSGGTIRRALSCSKDLLPLLFPSAWPGADLADSACESSPLGRDAPRFTKLGGKGEDGRDVDTVLFAIPGSAPVPALQD